VLAALSSWPAMQIVDHDESCRHFNIPAFDSFGEFTESELEQIVLWLDHGGNTEHPWPIPSRPLNLDGLDPRVFRQKFFENKRMQWMPIKKWIRVIKNAATIRFSLANRLVIAVLGQQNSGSFFFFFFFSFFLFFPFIIFFFRKVNTPSKRVSCAR
jgi:hypothetical protein